jgi:putative transposase
MPNGWTRSVLPGRSRVREIPYDNAAAESLNSLYKKELIDFRGDWRNIMDVTLATMEWVAWYNTERIHFYCGNIPPSEYEEAFDRSRGITPLAG